MLYEVAGRRLLIDAADVWSSLAVSNLFAGWFLTPLPANGSGPPHATMRIRCGAIPPAVPEGLSSFEIVYGGACHTDGETLYLDLDGSLTIIGPGSEPEVEVWIRRHYDFSSKILAQIISLAFSAVLRRCGAFELHSAGVLPPDWNQAILITGASGSGKSTITLQLASCGWRYLSDDTLVLYEREQGLEVRGLRRFFALTATTIEATSLPGLPAVTNTGFLKERMEPEQFFPAGHVRSAQPGAMFFPVITHEADSRVKRLTTGEAMSRLLKVSPWAAYDRPTAPRHLSVLGRLAGETVAFDILAGQDLLGDPRRVADLVSDCMRGTG